MSGAIQIKDKIKRLEQVLNDRQTIIARSLPAHVLSPHRFQQVMLTACSMNPMLLDCTPASLIGSIIRGASLGLDPEPALGQMYLVPFKNVVQLIVGYKGLVNLAWQSGSLATIGARAVVSGDVFEVELGTDERLVHRPPMKRDANAPFTHFYAVASVIGTNQKMFEVMELEEVKAIRDRSPSARKGGGPWATDFEIMARKTVLRRLCKVLPQSTEKSAPLQRAIHHDERAELGLRQNNEELLDMEPGEDPEMTEQELADAAREAEKK